jgi:replicative DNA helicase
MKIEQDWIQDKLKELRADIDVNTTVLKEQQEFARINKHLKEYKGEDKVITSHEIHEKLKINPLPPAVPSNHEKLDGILGGFYPGQHVLIGAQPKSGKSEFIMDLVRKTKEHNPLLLAFEQDPEELITIMMERGMEIPLFFTPKRNRKRSMKWISDRITEAVAKNDTRVVFVDHFGYINPEQSHGAGYDMLIVELLQQLKRIAKTLKITIVTAVHTVKMSPLDMPTSDDLKGSAGFRQEADSIVMLWREAYMDKKELKKTNKTLVSIQENRRKGTTGSFRMKFENYKYILDDTIEFNYENNGYETEDSVWKK